jgi:hypothetical protein
VQIQSEGQLQEIGAAEVLQLEFQGMSPDLRPFKHPGASEFICVMVPSCLLAIFSERRTKLVLRSVTVGDLRFRPGCLSVAVAG